jgi:general stress protein 26
MPITISKESTAIAKFLDANHTGVLATADKSGAPHAATIYFATDSKLNIYFLTKEETTKFRNLQSNPQASLAVYEPAKQATVQIQGNVTQLTDLKLLNHLFNRILQTSKETSETNVPPVSRLEAGGYVGFKLIPTTARLAVYTRPDHDALEQLFDVEVAEGESLD